MKLKTNARLNARLNSVFTLLMIISLTVLLAWLSVRYQTEMDWTESGRHTLSNASQEVLTHLDKPLEITAYAREDSALRQAVEKIVGRYQRHKKDINLHFVNPDAVPDEVRNSGITVNGEMVLRYEDRIEHVKTGTEEEFTNALERLARGSEHWLAFLEGHGERKPFGKANHDLQTWVDQLVARGFKIQPINLANVQTIPGNTKVLVIASPRVDLLPGEIEMIIEYLLAGGNILWLSDPGKLHGLEALADQLNVNIPEGVVIDLGGSLVGIEDPTIVLNTPRLYPEHEITRGFELTTFFPTAAALEVNPESEWTPSSILSTADHTWLETGELAGEIDYNEDADILGPLNVGISLEKTIEPKIGSESKTASTTIQQRIAVIGDGDFLSNAYVGNSGNLELGVRLINWLSNDDDFIRIPTKTLNDATIELSPLASGVIGIGFIFVLPILFFGTGFLIWWRRKKL